MKMLLACTKDVKVYTNMQARDVNIIAIYRLDMSKHVLYTLK